MDFKDHLAILREQYKQECDDNNELYRRGQFLYAVIGALGALSFTVVTGIKSSAGMWTDSRIWASGLVGALLAISAGYLAAALKLGKWTYPLDKSVREAGKAGGPIVLNESDAVEEYASAVIQNRDRNHSRFCHLKWAMIFTFVSALTLVGQAYLVADGAKRTTKAPVAAEAATQSQEVAK